MLATEAVARSFTPGSHATTFGGNPLACAAGIQVMERLTKGETFLKRVRQRGEYLVDRLTRLQQRTSLITEVRGKGLMIALDLTVPVLEIIEKAMTQGLLLNRTSEKTLRLIPPLTIRRSEIDQMFSILSGILKELE
jgi:acetylornithine/succinyldiaminopimelate/putrescine aminotransferase